MHTTPFTLLERLRQPDSQRAWERFVELYTPLLLYWGRRHGLATHDAEDLAQEVLVRLVQVLPEFRYEKGKSFRSWLRTVTLNRLRDWARRRELPHGAGDAHLSDLADSHNGELLSEEEYRQYITQRALEVMQQEFEPTTWKACWEFLVQGRPASEVAALLGITENVVYIAKCRVIRRLRKELAGLMDD
jgi:RNA polymerase sigma-70 factor (ECF subfamily)